MAIQHDASANGDQFVALQLKPGKIWVGKDSGERGGKLQDSCKDVVPNPEVGKNKEMYSMPARKRYKGGV